MNFDCLLHQVRIQFHRVPGAIPNFKDCPAYELVVQLQPQETIYWKVMSIASFSILLNRALSASDCH